MFTGSKAGTPGPAFADPNLTIWMLSFDPSITLATCLEHYQNVMAIIRTRSIVWGGLRSYLGCEIEHEVAEDEPPKPA